MYDVKQGEKMDRLLDLRDSFVAATRRVLQDYQSPGIEFGDSEMDAAIATADECAKKMWEASA